MTPLVPIMLLGWVPLTVMAFRSLKPHKAILYSVIGGALFLPTTGFSLPGLPDYDKTTAITLGLILGEFFFGIRQSLTFQWTRYDLPVFIFCMVPLVTSLMNGLGVWEGGSGVLDHTVFLGIPYFVGRKYFSSIDSIRDLCIAIVAGGLIYMPLCWYEIRMSPQLSNMFYGFFPHSFAQQFRYGGFRPVVFMYHGLMVAQWMAITAVTAFCLWRSGKLKSIKSLPISLLAALLIMTVIFCKSANGWLLLCLGCSFYFLYTIFDRKLLMVFVLVLALYPVCRITGVLSEETMSSFLGQLVDEKRESSFDYRLMVEDAFIKNVMRRKIFGWGRMGRAWPVDESGRKEVEFIDSFWIMFLTVNGFIGLFAFYASLFIGPWLTSRAPPASLLWQDDRSLLPTILSLGVLLFAVDTFVNALPNPIYFVIAGSLVSFNIANGMDEGVKR